MAVKVAGYVVIFIYLCNRVSLVMRSIYVILLAFFWRLGWLFGRSVVGEGFTTNLPNRFVASAPNVPPSAAETAV
jgi:hypothetical protein